VEELGNSRFKSIVLLLGVFTVSFGVLSFEISLTRIFSVIFSYHYAFIAVSSALFGLSLGGAMTRTFSWKTVSDKTYSTLAFVTLLFSLATLFFTFVIVSVPITDFAGNIIIILLPFFIAGALLAIIYKIFAASSNVIYFADLLGASIGSVAVVFLLNLAGSVTTIFLISAFLSIASLLFAVVSKKKTTIAATMLGIVVVAFFVAYSSAELWSIRPDSQEKELAGILADETLQAEIVDSRSSAFGRTDLVELGTDPHTKIIFVDGGAGTRMFHFDGDFNSSNSEVPGLKYTTQFFPYYFVNKGNSFVIGPGGGLDVLTSLMSGMNHTTAVEVNPDIVSIVQDYSDYNGGIYTRYDNIHVYVDEGRSFARRSDQKYDIIMLDIPITKTSQGAIGYALAENYLFTTNSFTVFLDRLNDDGFLTVVAHDRNEVYKLVATTFKLLEDQGATAQEIMQRVVVVEGEGHSDLPVFILKKTPFTDGQARLMYTKSMELGLMPVYAPYVNDGSFDQLLSALAKGDVTIDYVISLMPFEMWPPSDDSPFFYKFEKGVPLVLSQFLVGTIFISVVVSGLYLSAWMSQLKRTHQKMRYSLPNRFSPFRLYYFASLGLGFMLIEVPLIQKFILFLGHPTFAIAGVLFSLLISSGLGSLCSRKWSARQLYNVFKVSLAIGAIVIAYLFALPLLFDALLSYDSTARFLVTFAAIFPLGFLMGIPFPTGLRLARKEQGSEVGWLWCINGSFSLVGSVLALVVAMAFGFNSVLLLGALTYVTLSVLGQILRRKKDDVQYKRKELNRTTRIGVK